MKRIISALILLLAVCLCFASCEAMEDMLGQVGGIFGIENIFGNDGEGGDLDIDEGGHNHEFDEWEITSEPGCEREGIKIGSCQCGSAVIESIPATGHSPVEVKGYEATCYEGGLTDGIMCAECGKTVLDQMITEALGHDMLDENIKDENCNVFWHLYCTRCDYEELYPYGNQEHRYGEWELTNGDETDNDCTLDLMYTRSCLDCGTCESKIESGEGHAYDEWVPVKNETGMCDCLVDAVYVRYCYKCGNPEFQYENAPGHIYTDPANAYISVDPTEESYGELFISSCEGCDCCTVTQMLPPLHQYSVYEYEYKAETVGEDGYRKYTYLYEYGSFSWTVVIPAVEMKESEGLAFTLSEDGSYYILSGLGECSEEHIFIPDTYNGLPVKEIGYDALSRIPVKTIYIPRSIEKISNRAFFSLEHLETIIVEEGNQYYHSAGNCLIETATKTLVRGTNRSVIPNDGSVTAIGEGAFSTSQITHLDIPEGVTILGASAFWCCGIQSISLPSTLKTIDYGCFNATRLTEVIIPEGVETIASCAFTWCPELKSIKIPSTVKKIYYDSIENCPIEYLEYEGCYYLGTAENPYLILMKAREDLQTLDVHPNARIIAGYAFQNLTSLTTATVPATIDSLGSSSFYGCSSLREVYIDSKYVGSYSFMNCTSLVNVVIGDNTLDLGEWTFYGCTSLVNLTLGQSLERIGSVTFSFCDSLTYVVIPDSVLEICNSAFSCANLETIVIGSGVKYIDSSAIPYSVPLKTVYYKGTLEEWRNLVSNYGSPYSDADIYFYSDIQPTGEGKFWHYVDGVITPWPEIILPSLEFRDNGDGTCTVVGLGTVTDTDIVIPETAPNGRVVVAISYNAFRDNTFITSITIPSTVTTIGGTFWGCTSLSRVYISSLESWLSVTLDSPSASPFLYGASLYINGELATELVIPDGTDVINSYVFAGCTSIEKVIIPESVKQIGNFAFYLCSSISEVYYGKSKAAWEDLTIGVNNDPLSEDKIYFYSDVQPTVEGKFWHYVDGEIVHWQEVILPNLQFTSRNDGYCYVSGIGTYEGVDIIIPSTSPKGEPVRFISNSAFANNNYIESLIISEGVGGINMSAFSGCTSLKTVIIPVSLVTIGDSAFYKCSSIESVFYLGNTAQWKSISIGYGNETFKLATCYIYSETEPTTMGNFWHYVDGEMVIWPKYVPNTPDSDEIKYSEGLEITVNPDNKAYVSGIGECKDTDIVISATTADGYPITSIGAYAFYNCKDITSVYLAEGITSIGYCSFIMCESLETVYLPNSIVYIGDSGLNTYAPFKAVYYFGTETEWASVSFGYGNDYVKEAVHFYSETEPTGEGKFWHYVDGVAVAW